MKSPWLTKKSKEFKVRTIYFFRRIKGLFRVTVEKGIPRLHIHEKFEKWIKWVLRMLLIIGIATSVISFQIWYWNLLLAIILVVIEQILERVIFIFTTIFVTPIPERYDPKDWRGMIWGFPMDRKDPFIVGPLFKDQESARRIFKCLKSWNYEQAEDWNNNISLSAIIEDKDEYLMYMYPGKERESIKKWDEQAKKQKYGREHQGLVFQIIFCKKFKYTGSNFVTFKNNYHEGEKYIFAPFYVDNNKPTQYNELGHILKNSIKIKNKSELTKEDLEFEHLKFFVND